MLSHLPYRDRAAIVTSTPIVIDRDFSGVLAVVVELDRLSQFLTGLQVGKTGTAVLLNRNGRVVASAVSAMMKRQEQGEMPALDTLDRDHPMLASVAALARRQGREPRRPPGDAPAADNWPNRWQGLFRYLLTAEIRQLDSRHGDPGR